MPDLTPILTSDIRYRQAFEEGLINILRRRTAGTFILACANLYSHPDYLAKHQPELQSVFHLLENQYRALAHDGLQPVDAPDDTAVMKNLIEIGINNLGSVQTREVSNKHHTFLLNYNPLRGFRPARMSKVTDLRLDTPFNPNGFHFNKPFLEKEIFAEGEISGRQISLLYNKFPIVDYHALLVIDRQQNHNQYLDGNTLQFIADLQARLQNQNPHFVIAYNSLGAGASVNHLHFHCFLEQHPLPIFSANYSHNGGDRLYPLNCYVTKNPESAVSFLNTCHERNIAYNLLFKEGRVFCLSRKPPTETIPGFDVTGFGWSHLAGFFNVDHRDNLKKITIEQLERAMQAVSTTPPV